MRRFEYDEVDSTSERAFAAIAAGQALDGDVHIAAAQTAGRGRLGRSWHSAAHQGLFLSWVHMPEVAPPPAALSMAGGLALMDCVEGLGLQGANLKWPNDLQYEGSKLAGVLIETRGLQLESPAYVIGIGLNVQQREFPGELLTEQRITSLALAGISCRPGDCEARLRTALGWHLGRVDTHPRELAAQFAAACQLQQGDLELTASPGTHRGSLQRIDLERGLCIRCADGNELWTRLEVITRLTPVSPS